MSSWWRSFRADIDANGGYDAAAFGGCMKRRTFIAGLATLPLAARAQRTGKPPIIGYIGANTEAIDRPRVDAFIRRLADLGWTEGRSIVVDVQWSNGDIAHAGEIAAEFAQRPVDLILTAGDGQVVAAKRATTTIPIVFAATGDPVGNGLVASLAYPGGNATGLSLQLTDSVGKRVDLLRDLLPNLHRLGLIGNVANETAGPEWRAALSQAHALGIETIPSGFSRAEEVAPAIEKLNGRVEALYVCQDPLVGSSIGEINASALKARLPAMFSVREWAERGGLISYGPDLVMMYRRSAEMADKILRGTKPDDIPVEQPTQFDLVINLKTANAIGLKIPDTLLNRADEVIE
jgi:putative tryptophan/tyrosine transport system substrate-binding protein